ncbi:MAG: DNA repair protein RecN [Armatimonadota bacterium]
MLIEISVDQFALIEHLRLELNAGLTVLSGETGAGKSILINALNLALGERADTEMIRAGADKAKVTAVFDVSEDGWLASELAEIEIEPEDGRLYLSREISASGRNQARINGMAVPVSQLKAVGDRLVDLLGQHGHQSLLNVDEQLRLLDLWAGPKALQLREELSHAVREWHQKQRELKQLQAEARDRLHLIDLTSFQLNEIEQAGLVAGEEQLLDAEFQRMQHAERLFESAEGAQQALTQGEPCAELLISQAISTLEQACRYDATLEPMVEGLQGALVQCQDASEQLRRYREEIEFSPERLEEVQDRLHAIKGLKRKYGDSVDEILELANELALKLQRLQSGEQRSEELEHELEVCRKKAAAIADQLSDQRRQAADRLSVLMLQHLSALAMPHASFQVQMTPKPLDEFGQESVEFLLSANPGEPARSLARCASGGELSRVMLALKGVMVDIGSVPTLVFDEVDAGIGGDTALTVGRQINNLAAHRQVLCITHLPQIACLAAQQFVITKHEEAGRTISQVHAIEGDERVKEIARMLGGRSEVAILHARELLRGV